MGRNETCKAIPSQRIPSKRKSVCKGPETESRSSTIMNQQGGLSGRSRMRGRVKVRRERANGWTWRDRQEPCKALVRFLDFE